MRARRPRRRTMRRPKPGSHCTREIWDDYYHHVCLSCRVMVHRYWPPDRVRGNDIRLAGVVYNRQWYCCLHIYVYITRTYHVYSTRFPMVGIGVFRLSWLEGHYSKRPAKKVRTLRFYPHIVYLFIRYFLLVLKKKYLDIWYSWILNYLSNKHADCVVIDGVIGIFKLSKRYFLLSLSDFIIIDS